jgi:hypothetical protein
MLAMELDLRDDHVNSDVVDHLSNDLLVESFSDSDIFRDGLKNANGRATRQCSYSPAGMRWNLRHNPSLKRPRDSAPRVGKFCVRTRGAVVVERFMPLFFILGAAFYFL